MIAFKPMTEAFEWNWLTERAMQKRMSDSQGIVCYDDESNEIKAMCVLDTFTRDACNAHIAIDSPIVIRRGFLHQIVGHIFNTLDRSRFFAFVSGDNSKSLKFCTHFGMLEVARIPHGTRQGVDCVVLGMDRQQCAKWLNKEQKQEAA